MIWMFEVPEDPQAIDAPILTALLSTGDNVGPLVLDPAGK